MRIIIGLITAAMLMGGAEPQTFTGIITDDMCKKNHAMMDVKPDAKCILACVKEHGSKYALRDGEKIYKLSDQQTPEKYAGQKVKITGVLYEKTGILKVESIAPAK